MNDVSFHMGKLFNITEHLEHMQWIHVNKTPILPQRRLKFLSCNPIISDTTKKTKDCKVKKICGSDVQLIDMDVVVLRSITGQTCEFGWDHATRFVV